MSSNHHPRRGLEEGTGKNQDFRVERDFLGEVEVPNEAYYGVQTLRAVNNFPISGLRLPREFIRAQGIIKFAAARANVQLGLLDGKIGEAIAQASREVIEGKLDSNFVVDVYQAGAGTSQNMNANEVIANRALEIMGFQKGDYKIIHPNDHVNMAQSTNDTIHVAIHVSALESIKKQLLPSLEVLRESLRKKSEEFRDIVKIGRTHLQDAVPITLGQEFSGYESMITHDIARIKRSSSDLEEFNLGGTAVGTGLNAHPRFSELAIRYVNEITGINFRRAENMFESTQNLDACAEVSSSLRTLAVSLTKIANDLRLLSSGPAAGLAEIVNMVAYQIMGNDLAVCAACQAGQLELNVMMPVVAWNLLQSIKIATNASRVFAERCIDGIKANADICLRYAEMSSALATALSPKIGYEKAAEIAKLAVVTKRSIREIAKEKLDMPEEELDKLLDVRKLTSNKEWQET